MRSAFRGFVRKEAYHIVRDRRTLLILLFMPLVQVLLFGYAIRTEVDNIRLAFVDPVPDAATLDLRSRFEASGYYRLRAVTTRAAGLDELMRSGKVQQAIVFPPGFQDALGRGDATLQIVTDAADPNTGATRRAYALAIVQDYQRELQAGGAAPVGIRAETRMRFNPTMESAFLFVPGLIAFVLIIISALMTTISLTREKETGTMEVLLVSPLRPAQIIAGKVLPYLALAFANVVTTLTVARVAFDVPVRGSVVLLLAESTLYSLTALALGVLISSRTSSQRVAMTAALAGLMMPTLMLSGFIFPLESMPRPLQVISNVIPARWFVVITRGIMLKGVGLSYLWQETLVLVVMTLVFLAVAVRSFRIRLD
ncbi:MAG TPA: ABC transporter permease [Longimicrobiales bacterium]